MNENRPLPGWIRFYVYGMHGILDEIIFTSLFDLAFNKDGNNMLKGHSTIFTFFIYGSCSFLIERLYVLLYYSYKMGVFKRVPIYVVILYSWELTFGLILRQFDACSWDYSHYTFNFMGLITLEYLPGWIVLCLYQDFIAEFLLSLRISQATTGGIQVNQKEKSL